MKTITCKINNKGVHYSNHGCISWAATNLPVGTFRFSESEVIFWELALASYHADNQCLNVKVVDFFAESTMLRCQQHTRCEASPTSQKIRRIGKSTNRNNTIQGSNVHFLLLLKVRQ